MRRLAIPIIAVTLVGLTALLLNAEGSRVSAQNNNVGQALEIAPPVLNLTVDPGETVTANIKLRSVASGQLYVTSQINDFVAAGEDGTPKILLNEEEREEPNPYSIKDWIDPLQEMLLEPRELQDLQVTIRVPGNASPGGYFGVVRFTAVPPELRGTGVSLSASLGTLMLVRVSGDAKESIEVEEFYASRDGKRGSLFESTPVEFVQRLKNTGNIHLQPRGQVVIKDMFGKNVAGVNINQPPRNVLPASIRKFEQALDESQLGTKKLFGRYKAELTVTYGDNNDKTVTSELVFWVIPWRLILAVVVALVVGLIAQRHQLRRYNRRIVQKATGKAPPKKSKRKKKK
jgi:hypothetical protein